MKRKLTIGLALVLCASIALGLILAGGAVWDEETAVHIDPDEIEDSTLIIGTHLIHLSALTDTIYDIAYDSAGEAGQDYVYYKSELAEGTWFDITTATTLADITTGGSPVTTEVIAALLLTHHTKSDGITYDLRTGLSVNPQDIRDPYDLETLDELYPLKAYYDLLVETQSESAQGKATIARIEQIFTTVCMNESTIECDTYLGALTNYLLVLTENEGGSAEIAIVQGVMYAVDATRRAVVFNIIDSALDLYAEELSYVTDTTDEEGNVIEGSASDATLQSAVNDSISNVKSAIITYEGEMLSEGASVISKAQYQFSLDLIQDACVPNHSDCDIDVSNLILLDNINNSIVAQLEDELALLNDSLLGMGTSQYVDALNAGVNAEYQAAVAANSANVLLLTLAKTNTSILNGYRNELEFLISATVDRMGGEDGIAFIDQRLAMTQLWYSPIPYDDFRDGATTTVDSHITFLTDLKRELELAMGGNELDELLVEKSDLQTDLLSAYDDNDLALASTIEAAIAEIDDQINAINAETSTELTDLNNQLSSLEDALEQALEDGDSDLAASLNDQIGALTTALSEVQSGMSDGTLGAVITGLSTACTDAINDTDLDATGLDTLNNSIDTLCALVSTDPTLLLSTLSSLHQEMALAQLLDDSNQFTSALAAIEDAILNNLDGFDAAMREEKNADDLLGIAEDYFGDSDSLFDTGGNLMSSDSSGSSFGSGDGSGTGDGSGDGSESGDGTGDGSGDGSGDGTGDGSGTGDGTGSDSSSGSSGNSSSSSSSSSASSGSIVPEGGGLDTVGQDSIINLLALSLYYDETKNDAAASLLASQAQYQINLGNPLVFEAIQDSGYEYLPVTAIKGYTGMRYVWNQNLSMAVLASGANYYGFTIYSDMVVRGTEDTDVDFMTRATKYAANGIHVYEDYTKQEFGVEALYLSGTNFGILISDSLVTDAEALFSEFLN